MKKLGIMTVVAAWVYFALASIRDFAASDPVGYFKQEPHQLFYIAAIAVAGGSTMFGYHKLSPRIQGHARIFGWGVAAAIATATFGYFVFAFLSLASIISKHGGSFWPALLMLLPMSLALLVVAAYFWFSCWRVWKREGLR